MAHIFAPNDAGVCPFLALFTASLMQGIDELSQCRQICVFASVMRVGIGAALGHSAHPDGSPPPVIPRLFTTADGARAVGLSFKQHHG